MEDVFANPSVIRVRAILKEFGYSGEVTILSDSARTALDAANALSIDVGQVASSIVFKLPNGNPLLVITSGRHRVNTQLVAKNLGVEKLHRADANFVKNASGFSIGGVSPVGWIHQPEITLIDMALSDYDVVWAAAGHPHSVYPTSYSELLRITSSTPMVIAD